MTSLVQLKGSSAEKEDDIILENIRTRSGVVINRSGYRGRPLMMVIRDAEYQVYENVLTLSKRGRF